MKTDIRKPDRDRRRNEITGNVGTIHPDQKRDYRTSLERYVDSLFAAKRMADRVVLIDNRHIQRGQR
jgi:hypothetical protein